MTQGYFSDMDGLQMDVFNTFIELLRQTGNVTKGQIDENETRQVAYVLPSDKSLYLISFFNLNHPNFKLLSNSQTAILQTYPPLGHFFTYPH